MMDICNKHLIVNADKINMCFTLPFKLAIMERGSYTVSVLSPNLSSGCTVMLGCSFSGKKLPPSVVCQGTDSVNGQIKRETVDPEGNGHSLDAVCSAQPKAWMDKAWMLEWAELMWKPCAGICDGLKLLLLDEHTTYMTTSVH